MVSGRPLNLLISLRLRKNRRSFFDWGERGTDGLSQLLRLRLFLRSASRDLRLNEAGRKAAVTEESFPENRAMSLGVGF